MQTIFPAHLVALEAQYRATLDQLHIAATDLTPGSSKRFLDLCDKSEDLSAKYNAAESAWNAKNLKRQYRRELAKLRKIATDLTTGSDERFREQKAKTDRLYTKLYFAQNSDPS